MQRALECICLQTSHVPPSINQTLPSPENLNTSANWNQQCLPACAPAPPQRAPSSDPLLALSCLVEYS